MTYDKMKKILLEPANEEELKLIEDFIEERKIKAFTLADSKSDANYIFNDVVRLLIPFVR